MVTGDKKWPRWCGARDDLVRAIRLATELVTEGAGLAVEPEVTVTLADGITDSGEGTAPIENLHRDELRDVDAVDVTVEVSHIAWWEAHESAREKGEREPPKPEERISLRLSKSLGIRLEVRSEDRTRAEGIRSQLVHALKPGTPDKPRFDRFVFLAAITPAALAAWALSLPIVRGLGLASRNGHVEAAELVGEITAPILVVGSLLALWWMFPSMELFDERGAGRFRRFRGWFFATLGGLILAVASAAMYDAIH
jgi:hypothetical protein